METISSVIIFVVIILLIYVIIRLLFMKQYKGTVESATKQQVVKSSDLPSSSGSNECTYSIWIYIDNWNDYYGEKKIIFSRGHTAPTSTTSATSTTSTTTTTSTTGATASSVTGATASSATGATASSATGSKIFSNLGSSVDSAFNSAKTSLGSFLTSDTSSSPTTSSSEVSPLISSSFELYLDEYGNNLVVKSLMLRNQPGGYEYIDKFINPQNGFELSGNSTENLYFTEFIENPSGLTNNQIKMNCNTKCDTKPGCAGYTCFTESSADFTECLLLGTANNLPPNINAYLHNFPNNYSGFSAIKPGHFYHTCEVSKIPTQKWVNVVVSISSISVDIYINGKLTKTCLTNGTLMSSDFDVVLSPNGVGFTGQNARFQYWPKYMTPKDVSKIYSRGYKKTIFNIDQYSLSLGVYKGDVKKTSITI